MKLSDFTIGDEFNMSERRWRCTDIGTRVVIAIRLDQSDVTTYIPSIGTELTRTLDQAQAEAEGLFIGPPYAVAETVIDEDSMVVCWNEQYPLDPLEDRMMHFRRRKRA